MGIKNWLKKTDTNNLQPNTDNLQSDDVGLAFVDMVKKQLPPGNYDFHTYAAIKNNTLLYITVEVTKK